jgi:hypothetical protein
VEITIACSELPSPPPISSAIATAPSKTHQNTRCGTGASTLPPAVIVSITSEPESDEVTKNTITRTMPMKEVIEASGSSSSISNSFSSSGASLHGGHARPARTGDRGAAEDGHPQHADQRRDQQHADDELAHRAAAADARDEHADEGRPGDPPGPVERVQPWL